MKRLLLLITAVAALTVAHAQVGIGTNNPGTKLDVTGALTLREGSTLISTGTSTGVIPNGYSQVIVTGSPSGAFTLTGPTAPANAGQRLVIFNNTTGGYAATFGGATINNGTAMQFIYTNSTWVATAPPSTGSTAYIQNQTSADQTAAFRITGNGVFNGGSVGIGTTSPNASALLDVSSTGKGFLPPRMTTAQELAIVTPANGLMVYNTSTKCLDVYSATSNAWESVYCTCPTLPALRTIVGSTQVCYSSNNTYTVPSVQGASSYTWSVTGNPTITGNGTNSISFTPISSLSTYVVSVTATNACGTSTRSTSVTVNEFTGAPATPAWSSAPTSTVCTNASSVGYTITSGIGLNGTTAQTYNWTFTATGAGTTATVVSTGQVVSVGSPVTITGTTNLSYALNYGSTSGGSITVSVTGTNLCGTGSALTQVVNVAAQPSLTASTPAAQIVCSSSTVAPNAISTTPSGGTGTITYQWYSSSSLSANSGGTSLGSSNGAQTTSYTPPASTTVTTNYYYMVMSATGAGCTAATTPLNNASVQIVAQPSINAPTPATQTVCTNGAIATISATTGGGTGVSPVYQWYSAASAVNTGGTSLGSANGAQTLSYTPPATASTGNTYYYLTFSTTGNGCNVATSAAASDPLVTVVVQPALTSPTPATQTVCQGGTPGAISVTPSGGTGTSTYQWYYTTSNVNTGGTTIGASSTSYTPAATGTTGTTYFYATLTMTGSGCNVATSPTSGTGDASVTVVSDPTVASPLPASQTDCNNGTATALTVSPSGGVGTFSYQWYSSTSNTNSGGTTVGTNSSSYTPLTTATGTKYYYCVVSQSGAGCNTNTTPLNDASVTVNTTSTGTPIVTPSASNVCYPGTVTLSLSGASPGTNYVVKWYTGGCGTTLAGTGQGATVTPASGTTTTYYGRYEDQSPCSTSSSCGTAAVVSYSGVPSAPTTWTSNTTSAILGYTYTYSVGSVSNATGYTWTVPSGWNINSGQGTASINVTLPSNNNGNTGVGYGGNQTLSVVATNNCGSSSALSETVVVHGIVGYSYSGSYTTFTVPSGISQIWVDMAGAAGGNSYTVYSSLNGHGAEVQSTYSVSGGTTIYVFAGGQGQDGYSGSHASPAGGWNGGGDGDNNDTYYGGAGGGESDIRIGGTAIGNAVLVAGGGGGAGYEYNGCGFYYYGGHGGYYDATHNGAGTNGGGCPGVGGYGGTLGGGGAGQSSTGLSGGAGTQGQGGRAGYTTGTYAGGAGGGGGWYGGGGGAAGSGGGGCSYPNTTGGNVQNYVALYYPYISNGWVNITW